MERRDSSIKSQISDMIYNASLDDLDQTDNGVPSELYRVNVFGKNITIAPGKPKKNPKYPGIVYFYIYVIKGGSAIAKLGVYEKKTTETLEMYDLTAFPEGSLMLFDLYYNEPARINVFEEEVRQYVNKESKELFNYLAKYIPVNNANVGILKQQIGNLKQLKMRSGVTYLSKNDIRKRIMEVFDIFGQEPVMDQSLLAKLSTQVSPDMRMFALFILEYLLSVRFIFINNENSLLNEDEMREIKVGKKTEPIKKYIVVSLEDPPVFIAEHDYTPGEDIPTRVEEIKQEHPTEQLEEEDLELDLDELPPENNESFNKEAEAIKEEETQNVVNNSKNNKQTTNNGNKSSNSNNSSVYVPPSGLEEIDLPTEGLSVNSNEAVSSNGSNNSNSANSVANSTANTPANFNNSGNKIANKKANNGSNTSANANGNATANGSANATANAPGNAPSNATANANGSNNTSANATASGNDNQAKANNSNSKSNNSTNATNNSGNTLANKPGNATNNSSNANNSGSEENSQETLGGSKIKRTQRHIKIKS